MGLKSSLAARFENINLDIILMIPFCRLSLPSPLLPALRGLGSSLQAYPGAPSKPALIHLAGAVGYFLN